jgi:phosphatidylglycerol---prolipoprotein diacylglyceryl transferase
MAGTGVALQFNLLGLNISIHWYGIIIAAGLLLAILLAMYHAKREGHNPDSMLDVALVIIPMAVICARIYYVLFNWNQYFASGQSFWKIFAIWEGGLAIYGGVIGGFLGILIYNKFINKKIGLYNLLDIAAPSLILGQAIGRWGNFFNQEAYGYAVIDPSWQWFPASVYIKSPMIYDGSTTQLLPEGWFMATFFYESMWNLLVFAFLFFYFKNYKKRKPGDIFWFYVLLYSIGRAVIEGMRTDSLYIPGTQLRISQLLSIGLALVAAIMILPSLFKRIYANVEERRLVLEKAPLDESLRLQVEVKDDVEETESSSAQEMLVEQENKDPGGAQEPQAELEGEDTKKEG